MVPELDLTAFRVDTDIEWLDITMAVVVVVEIVHRNSH